MRAHRHFVWRNRRPPIGRFWAGAWHNIAYQGKLTNVDPVIIASGRKHAVHDDDILHAYRQPVRVLELDDLVMLI